MTTKAPLFLAVLLFPTILTAGAMAEAGLAPSDDAMVNDIGIATASTFGFLQPGINEGAILPDTLLSRWSLEDLYLPFNDTVNKHPWGADMLKKKVTTDTDSLLGDAMEKYDPSNLPSPQQLRRKAQAFRSMPLNCIM